MRGGAVWQLVGLITRRSQVQILPPLPDNLAVGCEPVAHKKKAPQPGPFLLIRLMPRLCMGAILVCDGVSVNGTGAAHFLFDLW